MEVYVCVSWASMGFYLAAIYLSSSNLYQINFNNRIFDRRKINRCISNLILIMILCLSIAYIILKGDWILNERYDHNKGLIMLLWLTYNYFIGTLCILINITIASNIRVRVKHV